MTRATVGHVGRSVMDKALQRRNLDMSDVNPVLDRLAHGSAEARMKLFQHHDRAAHHLEKAAEHHRLAAEAYRSGDTAAAASHTTQALGHGAHAQHHANESLKGYVSTSDEPPLGYNTLTSAPSLDPNAAYTPGIR
jgi:hypothetical protein